MPYSPKPRIVLEREQAIRMIVKCYELYSDEEDKPLEIASLVAFLWLSGARISEVLAIIREDIKMDEENIYATITPLKQWRRNNKGEIKRKKLPISLVFPRKKTIFTRLIIEQALEKKAGERLWDISRITAWRRIVELNPNIYLHTFRSSRATHLADKGIGDDQLKRWFGWSPKSFMPSNYIRYSKIQMSRIGEALED